MRLEHDDDALPVAFARRLDRGDDLAGQVRVVVDERDAVALAAELEAAGDAAEPAERAAHRVERHTQLERDGRRARRVLSRCAARAPAARPRRATPRRAPSTNRRPAPPALVLGHPVVGIVGEPVGDEPPVGAVPRARPAATTSSAADDAHAGHGVEEPLEAVDQRREVTVVVEVVGLDVGDDRVFGVELEERAVALVGLDDEPLAVVPRQRWCRPRSGRRR